METRLINVNDLGRYTVVIAGHRYVPWTSLAEVPTAQQTTEKLDRRRWCGCETCKGGRYRSGGYCPGCGRPLTEEAWAELERRINDGTTD